MKKEIEYYLLSVPKPNRSKFRIKYKLGFIHSITKQSGKITEAEAWKKILLSIPYKEYVITQKKLSLPPKITLEPVFRKEPQSVFKRFLDIYVHFYQNEYELPPQVNVTQTKALNETIKYISSITKSVDEAVDVWAIIFNNWEYLDEFYQKLTKLSQINQYISHIIIQVKKITESGR